MSDTVIVALISFVGTLAGAFFANKKSTALIAYRLEELEKRVHEHNNLASRILILEEWKKFMESRD